MAFCTVAFALRKIILQFGALGRVGLEQITNRSNLPIEMLAGGEAEGTWLLPDVLVNVSRGGGEVTDGVVKEVLPVTCLSCCELCSPNLFTLWC